MIASSSNRQGGQKRGARQRELNKVYALPLPLLLDLPSPSSSPSRRYIASALGIFGLSATRLEKTCVEGVLDAPTRSVWVSNSNMAMLLWQRGFFGKGSLSRSEPSWYARQVNQREARATGNMTAEEVREKRRQERKQFKIDRARAIAEAALEAERTFEATGKVLEESSFVIPSAATWKPASSSEAGPSSVTLESTETKSSTKLAQENGDLLEEELIDYEHLQLTLQEAFFLVWALDCLTILVPGTTDSIPLPRIWRIFQSLYDPIHAGLLTPSIEILDKTPTRFDNPFLIHYALYHHYRSLGWVVKGGIKFCVDYLLYKRGPVFSHAEFAIVLCPVYEDPSDRDTSPYDLQNVDPFSWSWLSTINRVNSQVQKTLVLTYVTIPAMNRLPNDVLQSPACLTHYSIREVIVRRFIPARMRD